MEACCFDDVSIKKRKKRETEHKYTTFLVQLTIVMITITREALHYTTLFQFTHIQVTMKHICLATNLFVKIINIYYFIQLWFHTNNLQLANYRGNEFQSDV